MSFIKNMVDRVKERWLPEALTINEAKILAMMSVIASDEKNPTREIGLMTAMCSFDKRFEGMNYQEALDHFNTYKNDMDLMYQKIGESITEREDRLGLIASAFLLAGIDGNISKEEMQMLERLCNILRLTLEDMYMIKEKSKFILDTMMELRILA